jgi:exo-beta-1,3-glucanase (GH17 family)
MPCQAAHSARLATPLLVLLLAGSAAGQPAGQPPAGVGPQGSSLRPMQPAADRGWFGHGICYGPHRDGQRPGGRTPTAAQIREDLHLMARHWDVVRIFGASEFGRVMLEEIQREDLGLQVILGVWIDAEARRDADGQVIAPLPENAAANRREVEAAIALARDFPDQVLAVCVGNETQVADSPYGCALEVLVGHVRTVRAAVAVPVAVADDWRYWSRPQSRTLAREVDAILVHAHPLWSGQQLTDAVPWLEARLAELQALHPDRPVVIGETGWATDAAPVGEQAELIAGATGEQEQAAFYHASRRWAEQDRIAVLTFEAFDENWKGSDHPREVEKHWGLFRADRTPKAALAGRGE